jgi:hypothetical protein
MGDVVVELPVAAGAEADLFGEYFQRFVDRAFIQAVTSDKDAPILMLRSDPLQDREVKVVIFQERAAAEAFTTGWALVRARKNSGSA